MKIAIASVKVSIAGVKVSIAAVKVSIAGVKVSIAAVKVAFAGVKVSIAEAKVAFAGVKVSIASVKVSFAARRLSVADGRVFVTGYSETSPLGAKLRARQRFKASRLKGPRVLITNMFAHRLRLAALFFLAPLVLSLNHVAQTSGFQTGGQQTTAPLISLTPCEVPGTSPSTKDKARCGTFEVFEDRDLKSGRKLALKIVVYPATGPDKATDPLFYIPGGPGSSATEDAPYVAQQSAKIREHRDLVFVDQRGTGGSNPLNCDFFDPKNLQSYLGDYFPLPDVRKCLTELGPKANLKLYTTPIAMDDLEDVRRALGYGKINIIGGSYGTRAAQVFLKLHPNSVRAVILHGVSPTNQLMPRDFPQHTERALNGVMAECAADKTCHEAFPNLEAEKKNVLEQLVLGPIAVDLQRGTTNESVRISLSRDLVGEAVRYMLYQPAAARRIPLFIHLAAQGNFAPLANAAINYRQNLVATGSNGMYLSVTCAEDLPFIKPGEGERNGANTFLGDYRLRQQRAACALWPRAKVPGDYAAATTSNVPTLILTGQWDPVTPPIYGDTAAKHLAHSLHVVVRHGGHGFGGLTGLDCIDNLMASFIEKGTTTGLDTSCVGAISRGGFLLKLQ